MHLQIPLSHPPFWPFVVSFLILGAILYIRALNVNGWNLIIRGVFSHKAVHQLIREENVMENNSTGMLVLTFFFTTALFFYNIFEIKGLGFGGPTVLNFLGLLLFIFTVYIVKILVLYFLQMVFNQKALFEEHVVGLMNINIVFGLALLPINLLLIYGTAFRPETLLNLGLLLWAASFLLRMIKCYGLGLKSGIKLQYIILYLCTLEIIPIAVLIETIGDFGIKIF